MIINGMSKLDSVSSAFKSVFVTQDRVYKTLIIVRWCEFIHRIQITSHDISVIHYYERGLKDKTIMKLIKKFLIWTHKTAQLNPNELWMTKSAAVLRKFYSNNCITMCNAWINTKSIPGDPRYSISFSRFGTLRD